MLFDTPPDPPKLWMPPKPAIIRNAPDLLEPTLGYTPGFAPSVGRHKATTITYIGSHGSGSGASSYNHGNFTIPADGIMLVWTIGRYVGQTITAVTIGGVAGAGVPDASALPPPNGGFWYREVAAGSRAVSVAFSGGVLDNTVSVWLITNYRFATPFRGTIEQVGPSVTTHSRSIAIPARGVAAWGFVNYDNTGSVTWTGATERYDASVGSGRRSSADYSAGEAAEVRTATANWNSGAYATMGACSWR